MQIVIDIPEEVKEVFDKAKEDDLKGSYYDYNSIIGKAIQNGTPLPKGHGRLGDLDKIWDALKELEEYYQREFLKKSNTIHESAMNGRLYGFAKAKFIVQDAPTIIEADKEGE